MMPLCDGRDRCSMRRDDQTTPSTREKKMTRIPVLEREDMDADQQAVYDKVKTTNAVIGSGPAVGYSYSPEVWRLHNEASTHLVNGPLTGEQVRLIALMTIHHWKAPYPWNAQAKRALAAGVDIADIETLNDGARPDFADAADGAVFDMTSELLASGNLSDAGFKAAEAALGHRRMVEVVHTIAHFCETALMANLVGAVPPADAVTKLKG